MAHDFDIEPVAEDVMERRGGALGLGGIVAQERLRHQARHAAREDDQSLVVLGQQIHVDARLVVIPFEKALRDQRREVPIPDQISGEQRDVRFVTDAPIATAARSDVRLAADDGDELVLARGVVELHRAVHDAVIRQGDPRRSIFGRATTKRVDAASAVEQ